jgi:hypothetical protein
MRSETNADKIRKLIHELGRKAKGPGKVYLTGGATAVLFGWRNATVDVDLKLDPEPNGIFDAIRDLKDKLDINIELASPDQFIPPVPGWEERSQYIASYNQVQFYHFDFYAQALSKIERGHERDLRDVDAMLKLGLINKAQLWDFFQKIEPNLIKYPSINPKIYREKMIKFLEQS